MLACRWKGYVPCLELLEKLSAIWDFQTKYVSSYSVFINDHNNIMRLMLKLLQTLILSAGPAFVAALLAAV